MISAAPPPVTLDGATLTPAGVAAIARGGALVTLSPEAGARNARARATLTALLERGHALYGATTGVGSLRHHGIAESERAEHSLALLRSHACGAGAPLPAEEVRAAMAVRANQLGAGGAGVADELLRGLVAALNAGLTPFTRELGSLGTGDLTGLADVALALLGEGRVRRGDELVDAGPALAQAGIPPARVQPRDGLAFMSSNAFSVGLAALVAVDARRLLDAWLTVAALSFEAAAADPVVLDPRAHAAPHRPGQTAVAARMWELLGAPDRRPPRPDRPAAVQDPFPFRVQPQVDGAVADALRVLEEVVGGELNFAGENALVLAGDAVALPNGNFHTARLAGAVDGLRAALAASAALVGARVSSLLDAGVTGLRPYLARRPGHESGAMILEYTVHSAVAECRSLAMPVAVQTVSVAQGVESHSSLAPVAVRRAREMLAALRVAVAVELVVAVRALRMAAQLPAGPGPRALWDAAAPALDDDGADRPLHPDVEAARQLIAAWEAGPGVMSD